MFSMPGHECYHCKQWVEKGDAHDCWTTTEAALTRELTEDLREAWERLRETAVEFGEQRIYASHKSIMFARRVCYAFVRPKRSFLELCLFLDRPVVAPQVKRSDQTSRTKYANLIQIRHRDEVEAPITDWLREAFDLPDHAAARDAKPKAGARTTAAKKRPSSTGAQGASSGRRPSGKATPGRRTRS